MPDLSVILSKIDATRNMQELAAFIHQLPTLAFGLNSEQAVKAISNRIEAMRKIFKEHKYIVHMLVADRQQYLDYNPMLRDFANNIQTKVINELAYPTLKYVANMLKTLEYSLSLADIQVAALKAAHYLQANAKDLNWQYSVYVELMERLGAKLIAEYTKQAPNLSKVELHIKIVSLKQEMQACVFNLGRGTEYEMLLDRCVDICKNSKSHNVQIAVSSSPNQISKVPNPGLSM